MLREQIGNLEAQRRLSGSRVAAKQGDTGSGDPTPEALIDEAGSESLHLQEAGIGK